MLEDAFNCASCDTTCYQECTGCSGECTGSCQGGCDGSCMFNCNDTCYHTCIGTCDNTCSGTCSTSCSGGARSTTGSKDVLTSYYIRYAATCRPKIVKVSDDTFVLFITYGTSTSSSSPYTGKVILIAFRIDSNGFITYGTQTLCDINYNTSDVLSLYDYDSTCGIKQLIVANNIDSGTITVFTINVSDSLDITIGTSSNISSATNPSIQYAQYKPGYTPTGNYNFVKLLKDTNGSDVYIVSISYAKQFSLCIGSIESNGIVLNTSAVVDADVGISDPSNRPELFFLSDFMNNAGAYSIENWYIKGTRVTMLSTSFYPASTGYSSYIQNRALILSWNCANMLYNYTTYTINGETPFIVDIYNLSKSLKSYGNIYIVIDYMSIRRQVDTQAIRITPYALVDNKFIQCGQGSIIGGLINNPDYTPHEYISSVMVDDYRIFISASFIDNLIHTAGKRYLIQLHINVRYKDDIVAISPILHTNIPVSIKMYSAPLLKCFTCNATKYLLICDFVAGGSSNVSAVLLMKLFIDGSTAPWYGIKNIQTLYTHTNLYCPNQNNILFQQINTTAFRMLFAAPSSDTSGKASGTVAYNKTSLCVISFELDSEGVPTITTTDYTTLIATNDDGTVGLPTTSYSMIIDEIFHDNLLLVITSNKIILYYWSPTDNLFYIKDTYTISNIFNKGSGYYKNEWYFRYSDDEIMLLDVNNSKKGMLLQITPDAKIINLGYSSMDDVIETFDTKTHKMTNIDGTPYLINSTGNGAIAAAPLKVSRGFKKLGGYGNANPMTIVMDDSTTGKCCKTITPYMEVEEEHFIEGGGVIIIPPIG